MTANRVIEFRKEQLLPTTTFNIVMSKQVHTYVLLEPRRLIY